MIRSAPSSTSLRDVIVVGAGPAGAVAATLLARAGARVCLIDRATFPRPKLCGDTLNPGALAILRRLGLADLVERRGLRVDGMIVTGASGVTIEGRYPGGQAGRALLRAELDAALVNEATSAGAELLAGTTVRRPLVESTATESTVVGVAIAEHDAHRELRAPVTIAADGRHSTLAFALGLARHPAAPRRWAIGAYAEAVTGTSSFGEMHIRPGRYIGVAPLPDGLTNFCLVRPASGADATLRNPLAALKAELAGDRVLRDRFAGARFVCAPVVLGPLAVEAMPQVRTPDGLLLAGDAGGFVDPMTGDGLRFAIRGGEMAAEAALRVLASGWTNVQQDLAAARRREFGAKWRFNRLLRGLVASPTAVRVATYGARFAPSVVRAIVARAGDCDLAERPA